MPTCRCLAFAALLLAASTPAFAQQSQSQSQSQSQDDATRSATAWNSPEWWVDVNVASHHFGSADAYLGPGEHFNQANYGAGVELEWQPRHGASAGYYRNSVYADSWYALYHYTPLQLGRHVRLGAMVGLVSGYPGYDGHAGPAAALVAKIEYRRVGANLVYLPHVPGSTPNTLGLQLKFRLGR
ncbi:hypothetical protein [Cognatilysobacter lacus]|uniref:Lipid A palmitoyltransferase PagP n=1 Tax=Cognatilysobacter lacus TaxID=1643323 RepID=A0A5D8Z4I8_9GAMM|nr:hypothetical protein [Lysobacter lacus]TZF89915.1 hypothetical protein FW784_07340 [Lysobacter lacus]